LGSSSGQKYSIEQQNKNLNFLFVYWQTFRQKVINCPAIANAWTLAATTTSLMLKTLTLFLLFPFIGFSQTQKLLTQDYNFLVTDGEISKLHQSNDTLYEFHCYIDRPCQPMPEKHSKIISLQQTKDFTILKLEQLDTIPLTTDPYPATRYSVGVFKDIDNKKLGYLKLVSGLTKQQIDTVRIDSNSLNDMFFFTFYSDAYLKELSALKKVTTKIQVLEIMDVVKSNQFKLLAEKYRKTKTGDMYGTGFSAEILARACIEKGYNPIGAGRVINKLMR
jgi:hypothetical protein